MGVVDTIRRRLNLRGVRVAIETHERLFFQGDEVLGEVRLDGGGFRQVIEGVKLELIEFWRVRGEGSGSAGEGGSVQWGWREPRSKEEDAGPSDLRSERATTGTPPLRTGLRPADPSGLTGAWKSGGRRGGADEHTGSILNRSTARLLGEGWLWKSRGSGERRRAEESVTLSGLFALEAGAVKRFPFQLKLPRNCRLTSVDGGWRLRADVGVEDAFRIRRPRVEVPVKVSPASALMGFIKALEKGPRLREDPHKRSWNARTGEVRVWFHPPEHFTGELDAILLYLKTEADEAVTGRFVFDLQERDAVDYLKAAMHLDRATTSFRLAREEIIDPKGHVNTDPIVEVCMARVLKER